jgi:hypothetical protein
MLIEIVTNDSHLLSTPANSPPVHGAEWQLIFTSTVVCDSSYESVNHYGWVVDVESVDLLEGIIDAVGSSSFARSMLTGLMILMPDDTEQFDQVAQRQYDDWSLN